MELENKIIIDIEDKIKYFNVFKEILLNKEAVKPSSLEDIEEKVLAEQIDKAYYSQEANFLFSEIMFYIAFTKKNIKINSDIINNFYTENQDKVYKRKFSIENGLIIESEKGFLDKNRKTFIESTSFKQLKEFFEKTMSPQ